MGEVALEPDQVRLREPGRDLVVHLVGISSRNVCSTLRGENDLHSRKRLLRTRFASTRWPSSQRARGITAAKLMRAWNAIRVRSARIVAGPQRSPRRGTARTWRRRPAAPLQEPRRSNRPHAWVGSGWRTAARTPDTSTSPSSRAPCSQLPACRPAEITCSRVKSRSITYPDVMEFGRNSHPCWRRHGAVPSGAGRLYESLNRRSSVTSARGIPARPRTWRRRPDRRGGRPLRVFREARATFGAGHSRSPIGG
jgi:hypothetical protein